MFLFGGKFRHFSLYPLQVWDVKSLFTWRDNFSSCSATNSLFFSALFPVVSLSQMRKCLGFFFPYFTTPTCDAQSTCVTLKNSFSTFLNTLNLTRGNFPASFFFILSQDKRRFASVLESTHTEKSQARVRGEGKVWRKRKVFIFSHMLQHMKSANVTIYSDLSDVFFSVLSYTRSLYWTIICNTWFFFLLLSS